MTPGYLTLSYDRIYKKEEKQLVGLNYVNLHHIMSFEVRLRKFESEYENEWKHEKILNLESQFVTAVQDLHSKSNTINQLKKCSSTPHRQWFRIFTKILVSGYHRWLDYSLGEDSGKTRLYD